MKYAYIALLILVLYVAGMYESAALMVLFCLMNFVKVVTSFKKEEPVNETDRGEGVV